VNDVRCKQAETVISIWEQRDFRGKWCRTKRRGGDTSNSNGSGGHIFFGGGAKETVGLNDERIYTLTDDADNSQLEPLDVHRAAKIDFWNASKTLSRPSKGSGNLIGVS